MKNLNWVAQTILLVIAASCFVASIIAPVYLIWAAFLQFIIGCWQIIGAIIFSITWRNNDVYSKKFLKIYWSLVIAYFAGLIGFMKWGKFDDIILGVWFYSAWIIAIYYYLVTQKFVKIKSERKTFLDIAN